MISDLLFLGFEFSNIFEPAGIVILGCFAVVFWARIYQNMLDFVEIFTNDNMRDDASNTLQVLLKY